MVEQTTAPGATPEDWNHFDFLLELREDLLPVVSNPAAKPSPNSKLRDVGKVPSVYNRDGHVVGLPKWTAHRASDIDITRWSQQPDYGICLQTRLVRAIDVDITDPVLAAQVDAAIPRHLPRRRRSNSPKFLVAFRLPGDYTKRIIRTAAGNIEFLAGGQQFVAVGLHSSGVRYEWEGGLPAEIPSLNASEFDEVWK